MAMVEMFPSLHISAGRMKISLVLPTLLPFLPGAGGLDRFSRLLSNISLLSYRYQSGCNRAKTSLLKRDRDCNTMMLPLVMGGVPGTPVIRN